MDELDDNWLKKSNIPKICFIYLKI